MSESVIVTIDGPSASGKSTVAGRVAARLGYVCVNSGALYRGITWKMLRDGIEPSDTSRLIKCLRSADVDLFLQDESVRFTIGGVDPAADLCAKGVTERVSEVAAVPQVREQVVEWLSGMTRFGNLVVEGRDIGSAVFPGARFKFYIDAAPEERARRRQAELAGRRGNADIETVRKSLELRDKRDSSRDAAPLMIPEGAVVIDTTGMTVDDVAAFIVRHVRSALSE